MSSVLSHLSCEDLLEYHEYVQKHLNIMLALYDEKSPQAPTLAAIDEAAELNAVIIEEYLRRRC